MATPKAYESYEINVYDKEGKIVKSCKAIDAKIRFGSVRKIMALLDTDNIDDTTALFKVVYGAWEQVVDVLSECFPDMQEEDWDNVLIEDLIPVIVGIAKSSITKILGVPSDSKN